MSTYNIVFYGEKTPHFHLTFIKSVLYRGIHYFCSETRITPDFHLTYSKNWGNMGLVSE